MKSRRIPTLPDLYNHDNLKLSYPELLEKCGEVRVPLSDSDIDLVEHDTREQSHGAAFFKHRAGRVGASTSYSVAHTNPAQPSISLINNICYPQLFRAKSKAINHGIKNESKAIDAYKSLMSANHKDFALEKCGVFIDKENPWMHATPDFLCSCSCCGKGCGEVKCPYSIDDCDFDSYTAKKVLVWKKSMEKFGSKEITSTTIKYNNNCALLVDNFVTLLRVYLLMAPQCFLRRESSQILITGKLQYSKLLKCGAHVSYLSF